MCCKNKQQRRQAQALALGCQPRQRGCCGSARAQRRLLAQEALAYGAINQHSQEIEPTKGQLFQERLYNRPNRPTMAGMLVIGLGMGVEKLQEKIAKKKQEKQERRTAEHQLVYGHAESSSASTMPQEKDSRKMTTAESKSDEAYRVRRYNGTRRSESSERTLAPEDAPPRYEEVVQTSRR